MIITYVVLHYLAVSDTIECINSILRVAQYSSYDIKIVVVDNNSPDNSLEQLNILYQKTQNVFILHNEKNLGFAKGNNVGFLFAKNDLKSDFIILLNNDTVLSQQNFNEVLVNKFHDCQYAVLGPDIITADGYHQNPESKQSWSFPELRKLRFRFRLENILYFLGFGKLYHKIYQSHRNKKNIAPRENFIQGDVMNTIINGACLIFSPLYIERLNGLYDKTFLYMEEDILKLLADYFKLTIMYSGELSILHKESISTKIKNKTNRIRVIKKNKYMIHSSKVYTKLKRTMQNNKFESF